ncbi:S41 family peptidase [Iodobacter sp. CM08]|uniref:S41 family peptidase n=1 Tax=Iodobacter sp. CM08 TaxID=3085902 RepID=UPI002981E26E|nr:S41 family peptidase [Iodobacter sp. CM08]MDW5417925.1 S41 family peptidase [Iodobacter sp. CM08]
MLFHPTTVLKNSLKLSYLSLICALTACGGSQEDSGNAFNEGAIPSSKVYKDMCAAPRRGTDPYNGNRSYPDRQGTLNDEKNWLRSWVDETYLWYREVPQKLNPASYSSAIDYFNALKTSALSPSGKAKDHYHFTENTDEANKQSQSGIELGYGMAFSFVANQPPRKLIVAYTEPNSPAALAGIQRGMEIESVDDVDLANSSNVNALNSGLFPKSANQSHTFIFKNLNGQRISKTLIAADIQTTPVQNVTSFDTNTGKVGYMTFNSHNAVSEKGLIDAVNRLKTDGVSDLILDLRYNGGGLLYVADALSYMIAGPLQTQGKTFFKLKYNDKTPVDPNNTWPFYPTSSSFSALPSLNLNKVTILAGSGTCSASEAIINGLRGIDVKVNLIGGQTCGKPYGFIPQDNCGTTYYTIQFQGENHKGFGDYSDGFSPTCQVSEDFKQPLGDKNERLIAAALNYRTTGSCPANGQSLGQSSTANTLLRPASKEIMRLERPK